MSDIKFPYKNKSGIASALSISRSTVHIRAAEPEQQKDRYGDLAVIRDGQIVLINSLAFLDWLRYRRELLDPNMKKFVPPFDAEKLAKSMGWKIDKISLRRPKYVN